MVAQTRRQRSGRISLLWAVPLFLIFLLLFAGQYASRPQLVSDVDLLQELQTSTILESADGGSGNDWPQWRGPRRDGVSAESNLLTLWPEQGPPERWRVKGGAGFSSLAVAQGRVYTRTQDDGQETVVCLNGETGAEVWRRPCGAKYLDPQGSGPRSTPTVEGDFVYTVGATGQLHCLEAATGKVIWQHSLLTEHKATNLRWGVSFSPLIEGDLLLTSPGGPSGNSLAAFDKRTGNLAWSALDDPASYSSPIAVTIAGQRMIVFFLAKRLVCVSPAGKFLGSSEWDTPFNVNAATPIWFQARNGEHVNDYLFISSGYGKGCATLKIIPAADGSVKMKPVYTANQMRNHFSSSVRLEDHIYGIDDPGVLTCLDLRSGKVAWKEGRVGKGSLLGVDRHLLVLSEDGRLVLVEANPDKYHEVASCEVLPGRRCWTMPALANGKLYLRDETEIVCLDLAKH
jgi:outer membrane protein assembly factor BamB